VTIFYTYPEPTPAGLRLVTVSRLVRYDELPATLRKLGFDAVGFSYSRREPFGSLFHSSVALSLWSLVGELLHLRRLQRARAA
jgi:hypothetical protein